MKQYIIFLVLFLIVFSSCREDEIIGEQIIDQKFLIATDSDTPDLVLYDYKNGLMSNDIFFETNNKKLSGRVTKIKEWGGLLYLLIPSAYKIEVINKDTYKSIATIDYSDKQLEPTDICFPNPTDAYVCHGNDTLVSLVDIYNMEIDQYIKVGVKPVSIAVAGNQIFVTNQLSNSISIIDSRTIKVTTTKSFETAPSFVDVKDDWTLAFVVSLGNGKINTNNKTAAKGAIFDKETKNKLSEIELGTLKTNAVEQFPIRMIVAKNDYAFILSKTHLLRLNIERPTSINTLKDDPYKDLVYFKLRNQLILVSEANEVIVCNASNAGKVYSFNPNKQITTVYPI